MNSCMRFSVRKKVDFPQPEGPMRAVTVPVGKSSDISLTAWYLPNHACTLRASRPLPMGCSERLRAAAEAVATSPKLLVRIALLVVVLAGVVVEFIEASSFSLLLI